jgi:4-amino-4-deoxy-L-arabinose transferase-like glycosyltransferase
MTPRLATIGVLIVLLAASAALRVHRLAEESLWLDEAASIMIAEQSVPWLLAETAFDVHPPLYYLALHEWMPWAGRSEFPVRVLSIVFDLLTLLAVFAAARAFFGRATALTAAALVAFSPFHLYHAQEARMYTLLALTSTLSMLAFVRLLDRAGRPWTLGGYVLISVAMLYTHNYGLFVIAAQLACLALHAAYGGDRTAIRTIGGALIVVAALYVPWAVVLAFQILHVQHGFWIARWPLWLLPYTFVVQTGTWWLAAAIVPLAVAGAWPAWRALTSPRARSVTDGVSAAWRDHRPAVILTIWYVLPVLLPFAISQISSPIFLPKYTASSAVALLILAAHGLVRVRPRHRPAIAAAVALVAVAGVAGHYDKVRHDRWREAVARFEQLARPNDLVLFSQPWGQVPFDYYLTRDDVIERPLPPNLPSTPSTFLSTVLAAETMGHDRVWFVLSQIAGALEVVQDQLGERFTLRAQTIERGVEIYLFERKSRAAAPPLSAAPHDGPE